MSIEIQAPPGHEWPAHVSYSSFTQWLKCGKSYELSRLFGVKGQPAWYSVGGSAVHSSTETYDRARVEAGLG